MGDDGIFSVHHAGVVTPLVEHADVSSQNVGEVHRAVHRAFIRADDHEMPTVELEIRRGFQKSPQELVGRHEVVEAAQRNRVADTGIMGVEGDDFGDTVVLKLPERHRRVKRLTAGPLVLTALVQKRHDDADAVRLAVGGGDDPLQILKVVVRRHMVDPAADFVGNAVVHDIRDDIEIRTADRLADHRLAFSGPVPREAGIQQIARLHVSLYGQRRLVMRRRRAPHLDE